MRIWDQIHPSKLCKNHLLGEHRELHAIWNILTMDKKGYRNHPEVKRWENNLDALCLRHDLLVTEMLYRDYNHKSDLNYEYQNDRIYFPEPWDDQIASLKAKKCKCQS